jgi:non-ribosomal peptide synthetase component F
MSTSYSNVLRQLFDVAQVNQQKVAVTLDDQTWTYAELIKQIERVTRHLHHLEIVQGQIIYQFVNRSFEMVYGLLGIMCAGGVYCSLNPTDPPVRLASLLDQIQGRFVLLHQSTRNQFPSSSVQHIVSFEQILLSAVDTDDHDEPIACEMNGIAYIICTSGTTGRQKAIVHTHRSLEAGVAALTQSHFEIYSSRDQVLQVAVCSWGMHLLEIPLPLVLGGSLVLLRPGGHLDMAYFSETLIRQQVTTLTIGAAMARVLADYLEMSRQVDTFQRVRNLCTSGKSYSAPCIVTSFLTMPNTI